MSAYHPGDSFIFDDAPHQDITSENRHMVIHSDKSISMMVYVSDEYNNYCAASGATIYSGSSDAEITLKSDITQLKSFIGQDGKPYLVAGLSGCGELHILDATTLEPQTVIGHDSISSIDDVIILDSKTDNSDDSDGLSENETSHTLIILS